MAEQARPLPSRLRLVKLKTRSEFLAVAGAKRKYATPGLLLQTRPRAGGTPEEAGIGFTVSRKVGNAVVRNRAKRRLRALAREWLTLLAKGGADYVLIGRQDTPVRPYQDLISDLRLALRKLRQAVDSPEGDSRPTASTSASSLPAADRPAPASSASDPAAQAAS